MYVYKNDLHWWKHFYYKVGLLKFAVKNQCVMKDATKKYRLLEPKRSTNETFIILQDECYIGQPVLNITIQLLQGNAWTLAQWA